MKLITVLLPVYSHNVKEKHANNKQIPVRKMAEVPFCRSNFQSEVPNQANKMAPPIKLTPKACRLLCSIKSAVAPISHPITAQDFNKTPQVNKINIRHVEDENRFILFFKYKSRCFIYHFPLKNQYNLLP